jgi:hypothetical protein
MFSGWIMVQANMSIEQATPEADEMEASRRGEIASARRQEPAPAHH